MTATRRLAAILAANVAGYSWLMGTREIVVPGRHANGSPLDGSAPLDQCLAGGDQSLDLR